MIHHCTNGVDYWTPTAEEVRAAVASSLDHVKGGWDLREQAARSERLEKWYELDGRHNPSHPWHGCFTGLAQQYGGKSPF